MCLDNRNRWVLSVDLKSVRVNVAEVRWQGVPDWSGGESGGGD